MQPFVSRTFMLGEQPILCVFDRPVTDGRDFRCDYRIAFPSRTRRSRAFGVDEIQALVLAMQGAHMDLLTAPECEAEPMRWLGMEDLGLPLASGVTAAELSAGR